MKKVYFSMIIAAFALMTCSNLQAVEWTTNYNEALSRSKSESKPVVLFFTGSDWCSWCTRIKNEALDTNEFDQLTKDKLIFVELDFPRRSNQSADVKEQNRSLMQKYGVRGYPTLVVIDSNERELGRTGYQAGGGKSYAQHLLNISK